MKGLILLVSFLFTGLAFAEVGFEHGNEFTATIYEGNVRVNCGQQTASYYCRASSLRPAAFSKIKTGNSEADKINVTAIREDRSSRSKSSRVKNGVSKKRFNLWVSSLLQRPLLKRGTNVIEYTLEKNDNTIEEGSFDVEVLNGGVKSCRPLYISANDCSSSTACRMYFNRTSCK